MWQQVFALIPFSKLKICMGKSDIPEDTPYNGLHRDSLQSRVGLLRLQVASGEVGTFDVCLHIYVFLLLSFLAYFVITAVENWRIL